MSCKKLSIEVENTSHTLYVQEPVLAKGFKNDTLIQLGEQIMLTAKQRYQNELERLYVILSHIEDTSRVKEVSISLQDLKERDVNVSSLSFLQTFDDTALSDVFVGDSFFGRIRPDLNDPNGVVFIEATQ